MPSKCIQWPGSFDKDGYGQWPTTRAFGTRRAHRIVFYLETGEWPPVVMHTCDNPSCVNIDHLRAGDCRTNVENTAGRVEAMRKRGDGTAITESSSEWKGR